MVKTPANVWEVCHSKLVRTSSIIKDNLMRTVTFLNYGILFILILPAGLEVSIFK